MWPEIIYGTSEELLQDLSPEGPKYREQFTNPIAEGLYTDFIRLNKLNKFSDSRIEDFNILPETEKQFWYDYASGIPDKFRRLNLFIRPFEGFCRTCIITDNEIESLVQTDLGKYCRELALSPIRAGKKGATGDQAHEEHRSLKGLIKDWNRFATGIKLSDTCSA